MKYGEMHPGLIVMLGSGETLASSGKIHEFVAQRLPKKPRIVILETPAGFEPNSAQVAGKIKTFLMRRLQNYAPNIRVLPARQRDTAWSPDERHLVEPILTADQIILGPGSPTYAARQLRGSLALEMIRARHRLGATLFLSSASTLAFSHKTMPVYEIYKVGEELHWQDGTDFFAPFGLKLVVIPHWNNNDGGADLDTSRCYMGQTRFGRLTAMLTTDTTIIGIDEHTGLILDLANQCCHVLGKGTITVIHNDTTEILANGNQYPIDVLGKYELPHSNQACDIDPDVWADALLAASQHENELTPTDDVIALLNERNRARSSKNWQQSDQLRDQIEQMGWRVLDTPAGSQLERA